MTARFEVYLLDDDAIGPTDGTLMATASETYEYGGYHRIDLEEPVVVLEGQRFSVVVTERDASGLYQYNVSAALNETAYENLTQHLGYSSYSKGVVNEGESYLFIDDTWSDWAELVEMLQSAASEQMSDWLDYDNFSIKAYADSLLSGTFSDVTVDDWFSDAVEYVNARNIMTGIGDTGTFAPIEEMKRQDVAVMLYRYFAPRNTRKRSIWPCTAALSTPRGLPTWRRGSTTRRRELSR